MQQLIKSLAGKHIIAAGSGSLKGLISSIPFVGSSLTGAWDGYWSSRLEDTIEQLSLRIEKLGKEKVDIEYVKSEEYLDLFQKALRVSVQSRSAQKAKFILGLLTDSLRKDRDPRFMADRKESFLLVLAQLTDEEMTFLYDFSQGRFKEKTKDDIYQIGDHEGIALDTLLAKGILREDNTWAKHIAESMFGREFIEYLKLLAKEDS